MAQAGQPPIMISPAQCRAARAWLNWTQADLAKQAGVGLTAVKDFEKESRRTLAVIRSQLQRTFEDQGVEFPTLYSISVQPDTED